MVYIYTKRWSFHPSWCRFTDWCGLIQCKFCQLSSNSPYAIDARRSLNCCFTAFQLTAIWLYRLLNYDGSHTLWNSSSNGNRTNLRDSPCSYYSANTSFCTFDQTNTISCYNWTLVTVLHIRLTANMKCVVGSKNTRRNQERNLVTADSRLRDSMT